MKKYIIALSISALALTSATPAFANNGKDKDRDDQGNRGFKIGKTLNLNFKGHFDNRVDANRFILTGTVGSKTDASLVVNAQATVHVPSLTNNLATVNINSDTKISGNKKESLALADIVAGDKVIVIGTVSGSVLTATNVQINKVKTPEEKKRAFGEVTAKTTTAGVTSVTIKNNVTGNTQTVTVNENTKVQINGETKAVADIAVGDSGWVKFKTQANVFVAKIFKLFR